MHVYVYFQYFYICYVVSLDTVLFYYMALHRIIIPVAFKRFKLPIHWQLYGGAGWTWSSLSPSKKNAS